MNKQTRHREDYLVAVVENAVDALANLAAGSDSDGAVVTHASCTSMDDCTTGTIDAAAAVKAPCSNERRPGLMPSREMSSTRSLVSSL